MDWRIIIFYPEPEAYMNYFDSDMSKGPVTRLHDPCQFYTNQIARFMQSLFTNCSRQNGES